MQAPNCPKCSGPMFDETLSKFWNNGLTKDGKQKPTWKCKDKANCDGVRWPVAVRQMPAASRPMPPEPPVWDGPELSEEPYAAPSAPPAVAPPAVNAGADPARAKLIAQFRLYDVCLDHAVKSAARYPSASLDIAAMCATLYIAASKVA